MKAKARILTLPCGGIQTLEKRSVSLANMDCVLVLSNYLISVDFNKRGS